MKKRPTILDIAAAVGVTDGTVSRALSGNLKVKASTRLRIQEAAVRLGYQPHLSARALKQGSHGAVGVFCEGGSWMLYNDYFGQLLAGVARGAEQAHERLVLYLPEVQAQDANPENDKVRLRGLEALAEGRVDGGIVIGGRLKDLSTLKQLRDSGLPLLLLSPDRPISGFQQLGSGIEERMALAARLLMQEGKRKKLGFLGLFQGSLHNEQGLEAIRAEVRKAKGKLPEPVLVELSDRNFCAPEVLRPKIQELLKAGCDGWVVSNAAQAAVALDLLARDGIEAPRDLSVIAFGPEPVSERGRPIPLAILDADLLAEGERCYQLFQALKMGQSIQSQEIVWKYRALPKSTLR